MAMTLSAAVRAAPAETSSTTFAYDSDVQLTDHQTLGAVVLIVFGLGVVLFLRGVARALGEPPERAPVAGAPPPLDPGAPLHPRALGSLAPDAPGGGR
jgi:hypothetical protein